MYKTTKAQRKYAKLYKKKYLEKVRAKNRHYYLANTQKINQASTSWQKQHPEKVKKYCSCWAKKNPEKVKAKHKRYYLVNTEKAKQASINWQKQHPEKRKEWNKWSTLKWYYGITKEQFLILRKQQKNKCCICRALLIKPCVDHCHYTNKIRGLLCPKCNSLLGFAKDNVKILQNAIKYLKRKKLCLYPR